MFVRQSGMLAHSSSTIPRTVEYSTGLRNFERDCAVTVGTVHCAVRTAVLALVYHSTAQECRGRIPYCEPA